MVTAVTLLAFFATSGGWMQTRAIRALTNDESTRAHRANAMTIAFCNMVGAGIMIYGIGMFKTVSGGEAAHLIMTVGVTLALISFAAWKRMALRSDAR
jgi:hypothetical protein